MSSGVSERVADPDATAQGDSTRSSGANNDAVISPEAINGLVSIAAAEEAGGHPAVAATGGLVSDSEDGGVSARVASSSRSREANAKIAAMQSTLRRMNSKPPGSDSLQPPTGADTTTASQNRKLGKQPATTSPPTLSSQALMNSVPARQSRRIARRLLDLVTCAACNRPYESPITLPCGHSTCLPCISNKIKEALLANESKASSSKTTHVPPRLPLCSITVPCSMSGCPRSAIGQGLGMWAGYSAAFGPVTEVATTSEEQGAVPAEDVSGSNAGVLPVDGFVVGAENQSLGLGVIPPQLRSKANTFAFEPFSPHDGESVNLLSLRPDVTLTKAVSVLKRFAAEPLGARRPGNPTQNSRTWRPLRGYASSRRMHGADPATTSRGNQRSRRQGSHATRPGATRIAPQFRALLGGSEVGRESGAVSGIRATDTDEEDENNYDEEEDIYRPNNHRRQHRRLPRQSERSFSVMSYDENEESDQHATEGADGEDPVMGCDLDDDDYDYYAGADEDAGNEDGDDDDDDDDDDFGGAFARPRQPKGYGEEAEERRRQALLRKRAAMGKEGSVQSGDSEWDTEASIADPSAPEDTAQAQAAKDEATSLSDRDIVAAKALTPEHLLSDLTDALECQLCYLLFYEPITTPCGHTFCRTCFARSLDHSSKCPLCRASMPSFAFFQDHPLNSALLRLLTSQLGAPRPTSRRTSSKDANAKQVSGNDAYPEEDLMSLSRLGVFADSHPTATCYPSSSRERISHSDWHDDTDSAGDGRLDDAMSSISFGLRNLYQERVASAQEEERESSSWTPIFVCTLAFPGMPTNLHIFEPRYRLMVRRCMQGPAPARFGMVLPRRSMDGPQYGTMLDIKSCQMLLDGRSMLETVGGKRFKLHETSSLDGYTIGRVEFLEDITSQALAEEEIAVARHNEALERAVPGGDGNANLAHESTASHDRSSRTATPQLISQTRHRPTMAELVSSCSAFIELLRTQTAPGLFDQILATYGPVPQPLEVDRLSWWLGMVLPIDEYAKSSLLPVCSPRKRLEMIVHWINRVQESWAPVT
ncbi:unnamed protein product [Parajaminaea phylloscopi]